jgi:hypothetical protein
MIDLAGMMISTFSPLAYLVCFGIDVDISEARHR